MTVSSCKEKGLNVMLQLTVFASTVKRMDTHAPSLLHNNITVC